MLITIKRALNRDYLILADGVQVGRAWRWRRRVDGTRAVGFGVQLDGVYWHNDQPHRAGNSAIGVRFLRDTTAIAETALTWKMKNAQS